MPKQFYPALIICLLGAFLLFLGWSAYQASTQGTQVTDPDYYSKGLKYNSTQVEKRAASSLGWELTTELTGSMLEFELLDKNGESVTGAIGKLNLYSRPDSDLLNLPLVETKPGTYQVQVPDPLKGEITIRVEFERSGARINRQLLLNI